jgi:hypothetical protein
MKTLITSEPKKEKVYKPNKMKKDNGLWNCEIVLPKREVIY